DRAALHLAARQAAAGHAAFVERWHTAHTAWLAINPQAAAAAQPSSLPSAPPSSLPPAPPSWLSSRSAAEGSASPSTPGHHPMQAFLAAHPHLIPFEGFDPENPEHLNPHT